MKVGNHIAAQQMKRPSMVIDTSFAIRRFVEESTIDVADGDASKHDRFEPGPDRYRQSRRPLTEVALQNG